MDQFHSQACIFQIPTILIRRQPAFLADGAAEKPPDACMAAFCRTGNSDPPALSLPGSKPLDNLLNLQYIYSIRIRNVPSLHMRIPVPAQTGACCAIRVGSASFIFKGGIPLISELYKSMLSGKSVIRKLNEYANDVSAELGPENIFDFSLGNPSVPVPQAFNDRVIELLNTQSSMAVHGYSPSLGIPSVREKIAASLRRRFGLPYTADDIFMTSGAAGALAHAFRLVTSPGDTILTFAPFFPEYRPYVNLSSGAQLRVVPARTSDFQINFDALEEMLTADVQAVLVNTPNNPSGAVYSAQTLQQLADILAAKEKQFGHEIWLISDEPYREIVFDGGETPYVSCFYPRTISCYSYSKSLSLPGERIGYVAVNPHSDVSGLLVNMCGQISRGIGHNCPSSVIQLAVADVCDLTADLSVYETNMNILYDGLTKLGFEIVRPGGTFYMFPKAPEADATAFSKKALKYGLVLVPSDSFGVPGYFRIAYCTDTDKVVRSLDAFERLMKAEY